MVAGEIKFLLVLNGTRLYVCDGVKTAYLLLPLDLTSTGTVAGKTPVNGEIIITNLIGSAWDFELAFGWDGRWYHTADVVWIDDAGFKYGVPGDIAVIPYYKTGSLGLPALLVHGTGNGHWWCPTGWVQV